MKPMVDISGGGGPSFSGHSLSSPDAESAKPEPPHDSGARASLEQVTVDHTKPPDSGSAKPVTVDHKSATSDSSTGTESDGGGEPSSASSSLPAAAHPFGRALAVVDGVASVAVSSDELATNEEGSKIDGGQKPPVPTNFASLLVDL
ncbi:hypothetical protein OsI_19634 [Oryza sativa Indica Group]|uniref:Uncharacterized protein n=1 Tax=Oryza sativa subsp. indica TaxID=39946 RepID=B8AXD6_ORYSI|nr:hypothetical protein OsI_19634 [Oryza sativa Indica Group]